MVVHKVKYFLSCLVKNKPRDGDITGHVFILSSMDCIVANNTYIFNVKMCETIQIAKSRFRILYTHRKKMLKYKNVVNSKATLFLS
jgi:hypothetical protein